MTRMDFISVVLRRVARSRPLASVTVADPIATPRAVATRPQTSPTHTLFAACIAVIHVNQGEDECHDEALQHASSTSDPSPRQPPRRAATGRRCA
jgi:hypothetical protein